MIGEGPNGQVFGKRVPFWGQFYWFPFAEQNANALHVSVPTKHTAANVNLGTTKTLKSVLSIKQVSTSKASKHAIIVDFSIEYLVGDEYDWLCWLSLDDGLVKQFSQRLEMPSAHPFILLHTKTYLKDSYWLKLHFFLFHKFPWFNWINPFAKRYLLRNSTKNLLHGIRRRQLWSPAQKLSHSIDQAFLIQKNIKIFFLDFQKWK